MLKKMCWLKKTVNMESHDREDEIYVVQWTGAEVVSNQLSLTNHKLV